MRWRSGRKFRVMGRSFWKSKRLVFEVVMGVEKEEVNFKIVVEVEEESVLIRVRGADRRF